jgi:hypothetical protein
MLINGSTLGRPTTVTEVIDVLKEKGLLLTSNLPVYIQGEFNRHTQREFTGEFSWDTNKFYGRPSANLNPNFACRLGDPRYPGKCADSDTWRAATVLSDAITLLSEPESGNLQEGFRYGVRNHGDFDLRNNAGTTIVGYDFDGDGIPPVDMSIDTANEADFGFDLNGNGTANDIGVEETDVTAKAARWINGFGANNYVTNGLSSGTEFDIRKAENEPPTTGTTVTPKDENYRSLNVGAAPNSSYFNNFITPVQRRTSYPEYVMEICRKLPVSACGPSDWVVAVDDNSNGKFDGGEGKLTSAIPANTGIAKLLSGTTARPALDPADRRYPRRVAFLRNNSPYPISHNKLVLDGLIPVALGIDNNNQVNYYATGSNVTLLLPGGPVARPTLPGQPQPHPDNALWYATTNNPDRTLGMEYANNQPLFYAKIPPKLVGSGHTNTVEQPQLRPTLQTQATSIANAPLSASQNANERTRWIQKARSTEFNLIVASNDVPSRALSSTLGETNGGMQNLPRFMENWRGLTNSIAGSFIQFKRSAYATAPYVSGINGPAASVFNAKLFDYDTDPAKPPYKIGTGGGGVGYFSPPTREWGFDVGLLSQPPDLFAQKFTLPASQRKPDEYFREISRDDDWVKTLVCAQKLNDKREPSGIYAVNDSPAKPEKSCP